MELLLTTRDIRKVSMVIVIGSEQLMFVGCEDVDGGETLEEVYKRRRSEGESWGNRIMTNHDKMPAPSSLLCAKKRWVPGEKKVVNGNVAASSVREKAKPRQCKWKILVTMRDTGA